MKKTLKFLLVIFTIIAMLSGNTAVLAETIVNEITSKENATSEDDLVLTNTSAENGEENEVENETQTTENTVETENDVVTSALPEESAENTDALYTLQGAQPESKIQTIDGKGLMQIDAPAREHTRSS